MHKNNNIPIGYNSWEEAYIDRLWCRIYILEDNKINLEDELQAFLQKKKQP